MTSMILKFPGIRRSIRSLLSYVDLVLLWLLWPAPQAAVERHRQAPLTALRLIVFGAFIPFAIYTAMTIDPADHGRLAATTLVLFVFMAAAGAAAVLYDSDWWAQRTSDFERACAQDESGDYALSREERYAVFAALRRNRRLLRLQAERDKLLLPFVDALTSDLAHAETTKEITFLAHLGHVTVPLGCSFRMHIQLAAGVARGRLADAAARSRNVAETTKD